MTLACNGAKRGSQPFPRLGNHDKACKHVGAVEMYREAQEQLAQATSLAVTVGPHDALERSLEDKLSDLY